MINGDLTEKENNILETIVSELELHQRIPSTRKIKEIYNWKSQNSVMRYYKILIKKGYLVKIKESGLDRAYCYCLTKKAFDLVGRPVLQDW